MATMYFKTQDGGTVAIVRNVPGGRGRIQALQIMRAQGCVEINQAEYARLKAEIDKRKGGK